MKFKPRTLDVHKENSLIQQSKLGGSLILQNVPLHVCSNMGRRIVK